MIYREFGKTGKMVSVLGMGLTRFSPDLYRTPEGREKCADLIVQAWEQGINYFDTAPMYCEWKSEEILGLAIKRMNGTPYISNKSSSTMDATADQLRRRLDASLRKMNVSKITFYNMWGILSYEQYLDVIRPGGPYEGALAAKREGLIDHICFSTHCSGEEIEKILQDDRFEGMTLGYNAINFKFREKGLEAARKKGIGVATMNPLNGGVIPGNPERFSFIKSDERQTIAQAALLFNAAQDGISVVLSGISNERELLENADVFQEGKIFSAVKVEEIKEKIESTFEVLCTGCNYCAGCPQDIKINQLMLAYNQYLLSDCNAKAFQTYMSDVWRKNPEENHSCIKCGRCERKCTQHLNIIRRIETINDFSKQYIDSLAPKLKEYFDVPEGYKLGIYASGPYAKRVFDLYKKGGGKINFELHFFDSDSEKWGKPSVVDGYYVENPQSIKKQGIQKILVASEAYYQEIYRFLKEECEIEIEIRPLSVQL